MTPPKWLILVRNRVDCCTICISPARGLTNARAPRIVNERRLMAIGCLMSIKFGMARGLTDLINFANFVVGQ